MVKKSLKTIIVGIFVMSMLQSTMVCSADETTTTAVTTVATTTTKLIDNTTKSTDNTVTTTTTTEPTSTMTTTLESDLTTTTTTTTIETTTPSETTSETSEETTITEITMFEQPITTLTTSVSDPTTIIINDDLLRKLSYNERIISIQNNIDEYLQNTPLAPEESLNIIKQYIKSVSVKANIEVNEVLSLYNYANNIVEIKIEKQKLNKSFYKDLNSTLNKVSYTNYSGIESYCKHLINSAFKDGYISSKETLKLKSSLHDTIMSKLSNWDLDLINYKDYEFVEKQSLVNKWNSSYPDMKGWIYIPNSPVDYPLMQPPCEDNNYYLQHGWNGVEYSRGSIELDYRVSIDDDKDYEGVTENVLIYGHNLYDNAMFSSLVNYKDKSYFEDHQFIEITNSEEQRLYQIYAVCSIFGLADGTKFNYWNDKYVTMNKSVFNEHIRLTKENMLYDTGNFPEFGQDILTLQTCDGEDGWRVVVFAKRVK